MIRLNHLHAYAQARKGRPNKLLFQQWFSTLGEALGELVLPWNCPICGTPGSNGPFCAQCHEDLRKLSALASASACPRCALPVGPFGEVQGGCADCRGRSLGFDAALALGPYDGAIRDLCLSLKHEQNAWLAWWVSGLFVESRQDAMRQLGKDCCIIPIPLHWWRRWQRGYNQAEALAYGLGRRLAIPVRRPLRRTIATDRLAHLGPTERYDAMRGAFRVRKSSTLKGRTVILVDDVLTTGATSGAAARALKSAGAARVVVLVIGRTAKK
jgi:ComF family protein